MSIDRAYPENPCTLVLGSVKTDDTKEVITLVQQDLCDKIQTIISDSTIHNAISRIYLIQECLDQMKTEKPPETK